MPDPGIDAAADSFEEALGQLQGIVHELEEGQLGLEPSLARFEAGVRLLRKCYGILEQAEQKIEILTGQTADGQALVTPFDSTATFDNSEKPARKPGRRRTATKGDASPGSSESPIEESRDGDRLF